MERQTELTKALDAAQDAARCSENALTDARCVLQALQQAGLWGTLQWLLVLQLSW